MHRTYFAERKLCPSCKSGKQKAIYSCGFMESPIKEYLKSFYSSQGARIEFEYLQGAKYILSECADCGLIFQKEIPDDFLMKKLYEEWISPHMILDQRVEQDNLNLYSAYAQEIMMLIAYLNPKSDRLKLLDFGMGWGLFCLMAKAFGCDSYGTELSETRIKYAKSLGVKVLSFDEVSDHSFDFINIEQVFEHISEPLETLCYLRRSLKPKGLIKISVPNGGDIKKRLEVADWTAPRKTKNSLNAVSPLEHINCFNRNSLARMADMAGLRIVKIPLTIQYAYSVNWRFVKPALMNLVRPLYRNTFGTSLFFTKKG